MRWCFTANQCTEAELLGDEPIQEDAELWDPPREPIEGVRYLVAGYEFGDETGRFHWQGYVELSEKKALGKVKELFGTRSVHWEVCKGSAEQNMKYCKKDMLDVIEWGSMVKKGQRMDLVRLKADLLAGMSNKDMIQGEHFVAYLRHGSMIEKMQKVLGIAPPPPERDEGWNVKYNWGVAGAGKSYEAWHLGVPVYSKNLSAGEAKWWDHYAGEEVLLLDDFYGQIDVGDMKQILQPNPWQVPCRNGVSFYIELN